MALTQVSTNGVKDGSLKNADIASDAAIALSKLATGALPSGLTVASANITDGTILNADINSSAAIALSKLSISGTGSSSNFLRGDGSWQAVPAGISLSGSTDNTIATVTGSNALQGEANLTFDGHHLTQTLDTDGEGFNQTSSSNIYIDNVANVNRTVGNGVIWRQTVQWNGTEVTNIKCHAGTDTTNKDDGYITFWTSSAANSSERLRIDESGNVGINQTNPSAYGKFVVNGTGNVISLRASSGAGSLGFFEGGTGRFYIKTLNGSDGLSFVDGDGSSERLKIDSSGNTKVTGQFEVTTGANSFLTGANVFKGTAGQKGVYLRSALSAEGTPSYSSVDDTNTGMFLPGSDVCAFTTGGTERLRIDSSAIYVKSGFPLAFLASSGPTPNIKSGGASNQDLLFTSGSGNPERLRIAAAGDVNIKGGVLNLGEANTSSGHINSYEVLTFNIDTDNDDTNRYFGFYKDGATSSGTLLFKIQEDGSVGVNCTPSAGDLTSGSSFAVPKMMIEGTNADASHHLLRLTAGQDADYNGAILTLNHSNDRGIAIYGGRSSGNCSWGAIKAIDNVGRISNAFEILGNNGQGVAGIKFYTGNSTSTTERLEIDSDGNFVIQSASNYNGEQVGKFEWWNENGAGIMAKIACEREQSSGAPGALVFSTSSNVDSSSNSGEGDIQEKLRIKSDGTVSMGKDDNTLSTTYTQNLDLRGRYVNAVGDIARLMFRNSTNSGGSSASIRARRFGDNYGTELTFYTQQYGGSSGGDGSARMRITNDGVTLQRVPVFASKITYDSSTSQGTGVQGLGGVYINEFGGMSDSNDRFIAPIDGFYFLTFYSNIWKGGSGTDFSLEWWKNGSAYSNSTHGTKMYTRHSGGWEHLSGQIVIELDANDYVQIARSSTGLRIDGGTYGHFGGFLISAQTSAFS